MDIANTQESIAGAAALLRSVRLKGVKVWSDGGQLRYRAPRGALTAHEVERLKASKDLIAEVLARADRPAGAAMRIPPRALQERAPLSFSQLAYWNAGQFGKGQRHTVRGVASATRLRGRLNLGALRKSLAAVVERHEALRTRIAAVNGVPLQEIQRWSDSGLQVQDLSRHPAELRESECRKQIECMLAEPVDICGDPLSDIRLIRLDDADHVLVIAMEHIVSDGFSLKVLLRDVLAAYAQAALDRPISFPEAPVQPGDYAVWQHSPEQAWIAQRGAYWRERLAGCEPVRFGGSRSFPAAALSARGRAEVRIDCGTLRELRHWCRRQQTTLGMALFTAYVALVLRWCEAPGIVVKYQSDSRLTPALENAVGYFASQLYLRIDLGSDDSLLDLAARVTREYCNAYEHADFSYLQAQVPVPDFSRSTFFNWIPDATRSDCAGSTGASHALTCEPFAFEQPIDRIREFDNEPRLVLMEAADQIVGSVNFPLSRFERPDMERFARSFGAFVDVLLSHPHTRVADVPRPD